MKITHTSCSSDFEIVTSIDEAAQPELDVLTLVEESSQPQADFINKLVIV